MLLIHVLNLKHCQRYASALPKTMPNKQEFNSNKFKEPSILSENVFSANSTKVNSHILQLKKNPPLQTEWKIIGTDGLLKDYLQVVFTAYNFFFNYEMLEFLVI